MVIARDLAKRASTLRNVARFGLCAEQRVKMIGHEAVRDNFHAARGGTAQKLIATQCCERRGQEVLASTEGAHREKDANRSGVKMWIESWRPSVEHDERCGKSRSRSLG